MDIAEKRKRKIAKDYQFASLSNKEIGEKYGISESRASRIAIQYPFQALIEPTSKALIKVDQKHYEAALLVLRDNGIFFTEVAENFELSEYYDSSINS